MASHTSIQVRCRDCRRVLPGLLRIAQKPDGVMLLHHLSMMHPAAVKPLLKHMETEDIGTVAMEAYERVGGARAGEEKG